MAPKAVWLESQCTVSISQIFRKAPRLKSLVNVCFDFMSPSKVKQSVLTIKELNYSCIMQFSLLFCIWIIPDTQGLIIFRAACFLFAALYMCC